MVVGVFIGRTLPGLTGLEIETGSQINGPRQHLSATAPAPLDSMTSDSHYCLPVFFWAFRRIRHLRHCVIVIHRDVQSDAK